MARDRLGNVNRQYGEQPTPQPTYPPTNGVIAPSRAPNPYAQGGNNSAPGAQPGQYAQYGHNAGAQAANPYAGAYGQQEQYAMGGINPAGAGVGAGATGADFWSELTTTNTLLGQLQEQIQAVRSAHQSSLTSTDPQAAAYASQLNDQARNQREECKIQIKKLYKLAKGDRAQKTQAEGVKTRFQSLLQEHQVIEKEFRGKVKARVERQYRIVNPQATEEEVRQVTESDNPQVFTQALLNSNRYGAAKSAYREVQERHAEIQKIEKTLTELAQMFSEMAMLVEQQDETIVNVETQAQGVDNDIKQGYEQTSKAVEHAKKARRKKWICFFIFLAIIAILALVLGIYFGTKK
ncbi:syntaxin 1B/2/3 [Kwoniella heveanensis CBS 569]|uniref:Syntaxin 1B/2/3 n=1 Tax=Kwoniella heveanensis BCC8398 TaxID=1296120 RepID=A0A1B9GGY3_9TREE|nr:syntaxin 1B/2/3 [Kwoniella heveanensis BCC8398]OCF39599.1 syntaxin 1B/2/3 [Kwoniella heveanensis CBS 569]